MGIEYPVEYVNGIMLTSIALFTIGGIVLVVLAIAERYLSLPPRKHTLICIALSVAFGLAVIFVSLSWFRESSEDKIGILAALMSWQIALVLTPLAINTAAILLAKKKQASRKKPRDNQSISKK